MKKKAKRENRNSHKITSNHHFWILLFVFIVFIALHYHQLLFFPVKMEFISIPGLERHAIERILLLIPISYAAFFFGLKGGIICLIISLFIMLPGVIFSSLYPLNALPETILIIANGVFINLWFESRRREAGFREQTLLKLEANKRELQSHVKIIKDGKRFISALHSISAIINRSLILEEVLDITADKIKEVMDIDIVLIFFLTGDSQFLNLKSYRGVSSQFVSQAALLKVGEGFNGHVAKSGESIFVEDITGDSRFLKDIIQNEGIKSIYIVPLKSRDNIIGTLCIAKKNIKKFNQDEKRLLILIGIELGAAADKTFLFRELQKIGRRFQEIFEKAHDAIWLQDESGTVITANQAASLLTGYELEELIGRNISDIFSPPGLAAIANVEQALLAGKENNQPYEQKILKKDGKEAVYMITTSLLGDEKTSVFLNIARDITEERRLQANLRLYADQICSAYEEERKRIARELHDDTIQTFVALSRRLDNYITENLENQKGLLKPLEQIHKNIDEALIRIRRFIQDLRPPTLEYLGLLSALRELASETEEQSGIKINLKAEELKYKMTPEKELLIYRIVQEAIRNVWKHSNAKEAHIILKSNGRRTKVEIIDDGRGFKLNTHSNFLEMGKLGLMGMRERAYLLGGSFDIKSKPDKGTVVTLLLNH